MSTVHDTTDTLGQADLLDLLNQRRPTPANNDQPANLAGILATLDRAAERATGDEDKSLTHAERFERFHDANPAVYKTLRWLAREWKRRTGGRKIGFPALYERARWELGLRTDGDQFLLNNNHQAYYSRLLMAQEPDLVGMFETRRSPEADEWIAGRTA